MLRLDVSARREKLARLCLKNAEALLAALAYCAAHGIGCFRINSQILPVKTHPQTGYAVQELPDSKRIIDAFRRCGAFAREHGVRTTFHPDQFVVLNSPRRDVVVRSVEELEYQAEVSDWVGADVINIHAGGLYGDKRTALRRLHRTLDRLSDRVRSRLTIENDDRMYAPADVLPICRSAGVPFVYDVHHHRCLPDSMRIEEATGAAVETWPREPLFHISSPLNGWGGPLPQRHHDFVHPMDFPDCWRNLPVTVEVEAKAKEVAVHRLSRDLQPSSRGARPKRSRAKSDAKYHYESSSVV